MFSIYIKRFLILLGHSWGKKKPRKLNTLQCDLQPFLQKAEPNKGNVESCSMHDPAAPIINKKFHTRKILRVVPPSTLNPFFFCSKLT